MKDPADDAPHPAAASYVAAASHQQRGMWAAEQVAPEAGAYREGWTVALEGPLDRVALARALDDVRARHDALRTRFALVDGDLLQVVDAATPRPLPVDDLCGLPAAEREAAALALARAEHAAPVALDRGPLCRARLIALAPGRHWLVLATHHIVFDRASADRYAVELAQRYAAHRRGLATPVDPLPLQYADYAAWQRERLAGEAAARELDAVAASLAGAAPVDLPVERRASDPARRAGRVTRTLEGGTVAALRAFARHHDTTPAVVLLAAFATFVHRLAGATDFAIGVPVAGRSHPALEPMIGLFANIVVLRADLAGRPTFAEALSRVRTDAHRAYAHADLPFDLVVGRLAPPRARDGSPFVSLSFRHAPAPVAAPAFDGLDTRPVDVGPLAGAKFDLAAAVVEDGAQAAVTFEYLSDAVDATTAARWCDQYVALVADALARPGVPVHRLRLDDDPERARVLAAGRGPRTTFPRLGVHRLVEAEAARAPDAPAVFDGRRTLSYGELDRAATQIARRLPAGARIALLHERGADLVVAMLAVLKAGGAYVPLDPDAPSERLRAVLARAGATGTLASEALRARLPDDAPPAIDLHGPAGPPTLAPGPDRDAGEAPACVFFTSGSTGAPKGVVVAHRGIARLVRGTDYLALGPGDVVAHAAHPAFDATSFEIWGALCNGATIVVVPRATALEPLALASFLRERGATAMFVTTALFNETVRAAPAAFASLRALLVGGEAADPRRMRAALEDGRPGRLLHVYGPTEATTFATWHEVASVGADDLAVPIGRPIANTDAFVLDDDGEPVPLGIEGELHLGGPGLALGYVDADETARRFVRHPLAAGPDGRLYRTGDRVRMREDGALVFVGRRDRQVKLRGHRIELDEVEGAIASLPEVREAAVALRGDGTDARRLVAYVVPADADAPPPAHLRRELRRVLPDAMLPASFVWLRALPLNAHGKVDRAALAAIDDAAEPAAPVDAGPGDAVEHALAATWCRLLGRTRVGLREGFFDLGGHSLLAARLVADVERDFGYAPPLAALFEDDTIAGYAAKLRAGMRGAGPAVVPIHAQGSRPPFAFFHGDLAGGGFYTRRLARALGDAQPLYVVAPHLPAEGPIPPTIDAMADERAATLLALCSSSRWVLGGYCHGAFVALALARRLHAAGRQVPLLVAIESRAPAPAETGADDGYLVLDGRGGARVVAPDAVDADLELRYRRIMDAYAGAPFPGRVLVIATFDPGPDAAGWRRFCADVETHRLPGDHASVVARDTDRLARIVAEAIARLG